MKGKSKVSLFEQQLPNIPSTSSTANQSNIYLVGENASLAPLYEKTKNAIVIIRGLALECDAFRHTYYAQVQGSGFV